MDGQREQEPFFTQYLEGQEAEDFPNVKTNIKAGGEGDGEDPPHTMKYPSDTDEPNDPK